MERLEVFKMIEGATLRTVTFDEGYLLLELNSGGITLGILPVVQINDDYYRPESEGYRNRLFSQIGKSVSGVFAQGEQTTVISFDDDSSLIVTRDKHGEPVEALVLEKPGEPIVVW